jgi:ADP-heptose:LPS heptosyltransferase
MYTTRVARPRGLQPRHAVENQWDLLAPLDIPPPTRDSNPTELTEDPDAARRIDNWMMSADLIGHPLVVVHVGAGNRFRRWLPERFADVIAALAAADPRRRFLIVSGVDDPAGHQVRELAMSRLAERDRGAVVDAPSWTLLELHAILRRATLYIGCDTGPLHVAGTTDVPIIGLYGPTLPAMWAPWRPREWTMAPVEIDDLPCRPCDQRTCVPGDFRCLTSIEPRHVVEAAERALASASSKM